MKIKPFKLERFFAKYEFTAPHILCSSDCESMSIKDLLSLETSSIDLFNETCLGYTQYPGAPELRTEITKLYSSIDINEVLVHAGAEEAIFNFMNIALDQGDHVIVQNPCYQSLFQVAESIGCEITKWQSKEETNWELDLDFLARNIKANTKLVVVNCPHNPTGYLMSKQTQRDLIEICRKHNLLLFSDEVYRGLEFNPAYRLEAACDLYENAISLGVMSKTYGLAGLRIGWIASKNKAIYKAMSEYKEYTSICNSAPSEFLATLALRNKDKLVQRNLEIIQANLDILDKFFEKYTAFFNWQKPKAGSIAFPSIKLKQNIESFCLDLIDKKGVVLLPSNYFDFGDRNFRIGFGKKNLPECINLLEEYLEKKKN